MFCSLRLNATSQVGDILIWKGDTLTLFSNPLELREDINFLKLKIDDELKNIAQRYYKSENINMSFSTDCWRNYFAVWEIINDSIFLHDIYSCHDHTIKVNLETIFPNEIKNKLLFSEWVNGELIIPKGDCIEYVNIGYESIFEKEIVLEFQKGLLNETKEYVNYIEKKSKFRLDQNLNSFSKFIFSKINWESLPNLKNKNIQVYVGIQPNKSETIDSILFENTYAIEGSKIITDPNNIFIKEAIRIAKLIPDWSVIYRRDKIVGRGVAIMFNENQKKKYGH